MLPQKYRAWDIERKEFLSAGRLMLCIMPGRNPDSCPVYLDTLEYPDKFKDRFVLEQSSG